MTTADARRYPMPTATRPDTGDMVAVHQMFRTEFQKLTALVSTTTPGDIERAGIVDAHLRLILNFLENHHEGEDAILWPLLEARTAIDAELLNVMSVHHQELDRLIGEVHHRAASWAVEADLQNRDLLALHLRQLEEILRVHLDAEERFVLPLVERHLTVKEWGQIALHGAAGTPRRPGPALALLGAILTDAEPTARDSFWATLPPHARVVWRLAGRQHYQRHQRRLDPESRP